MQTGTERVVTGYKDGKRVAPFTEEYEVVEPYTFTITIGTKRVRVAPFTQTVPVYGTRVIVKCEELVYGDPNSRICWPETVRVQTGTKTVPVYNYQTVPNRVTIATTRKVTKTRPVYNYERVPVYANRPTYETQYHCNSYPAHTLQGRKCEHATTGPTTGGPSPDPTIRGCPTGQYTTTQNPIWIVQTSNGPRHVTQKQVRQNPGITINGELADWEQVSSNCYKPVLPEATQIKIDFSGIISTVTDPIATTWNVSKDKVVAAWTYVDNALYVTLCRPYVGTGLGVTATGVAVELGASLSKAGFIGTGVSVAIEGSCNFEDWQRGRPSDQSSAQSSDQSSAQSSAGAVRPVGLVLVAGDGEIAVSWTASATVPADGFGYRVQWKQTAQTWDQAASQYKDLNFGSNLAKWWIIGLANDSAYDVRVAAYNAGGLSDWTTAQTTPTAAAPAAASGLSLSAGDGEIAVSWSASATTPAAGFGYRVQWKPAANTWGDAEAQSTDLAHGSNLATSHTIGGLENGSAYDVRVAAYNAGGVSDWVTGSATPVAPPEPPSGLSVVAGHWEIAVSWSASATTPAAGFGYRVQWKPAAKAWGDAEARSEDLAHGSDLATSYAIGGLENGSAYDVRVAAYNAAGLSDWIGGTATPVVPDPPEAASGLSLVAGDGEIAVSWDASATKPTAGFGYRVEWKPAADAGGAEVFYLTGSDLATSHTIGGLVNGSAHDVRVAAYNAGGVSEWITGTATPAAKAEAPARPEAASGLSLTAGDEQIAVSWYASTTTPAAGFGYRVQWKPATKEWDDDAAQSADLAHGSNLATSYAISGLSNGSAYDVRVAAYSAGGLSEWVTGSATPAAPKAPAPPWAHSTVGYATLTECSANAGERWCGYDPQTELWYVDTRS